MLFACTAPASVFYVDVNSTNPVPPYADWSTAAMNIQDAIDASSDGDLILVTNGLYNTGGRVVPFLPTNRVVINKAVTVQSVNGPATTVIQGNPVIGISAVRCVYLTTNAVISGFTLSNGATLSSGGVQNESGGGLYCSPNSIVTNCVLVANLAYANGGGVYGGTLYNCLITGNSAPDGGAVYGYLQPAILNNCILSNNWAISGGGASGGQLNLPNASNTNCILNNCLLVANYATNYGAGAYYCTLNNCTVLDNLIVKTNGDGANVYGGGVEHGTLNNCLLASNSVSVDTPIGGQSSSVAGGGADTSTLSNCIVIGNSATNFPGSASGGGVANGSGAGLSTLINCALTGNSSTYGGGADSSILQNCILTGNFGYIGGGGASGSYLTNCLIVGNVAGAWGGGADGSTLINCTVISNSQIVKTVSLTYPYGGGGVFTSVTKNCIIYYNNSTNGSSNYFYYPTPSTLTNCCTYPLPTNGLSNITNEPAFIDFAGGNFRLQTNSPCINAGKNAYIINSIDLDGRPRVVGGTVDIGAYEFQGAGMGEFIAWLQQYGLPTDGTADYADTDGDHMNNYAEWKAGTNPTNAASVLALQSPATTNTTGITVTWQSVNGVTYYLQSSTNLPAFTSIQSNIVGQAGSTSYTDTTATNGGPYYYRVGVQ